MIPTGHRSLTPETKVEPICLAFGDDPHYRAICDAYEGKIAERSGVPYINHIKEGLYILDAIGAGRAAHQAFCLHPLVQGDDALRSLKPEFVAMFDRWALVLAMEYRRTANGYLSRRKIVDPDKIALSPLAEVNQMLIADKIQNRKDYKTHHELTHPRAAELEVYFNNWLARLGVAADFYDKMVAELNAGLHLERYGKRYE